MKLAQLWISVILFLGVVLLGCNSSDDNSVSSDSGSGTETSFNFTLTSVKKQETAAGKMASFAADQVMTGQLQATNTDTSVVQVFDWSIYFDEDTFEVQSNKTIILPPGTYEFALLLIKGDQQYAGSVAGVSIADGTFDVPLTISPVIGNTITDVTLVASLAEFKFQYDPTELAAASLVNPQMGIMINGGVENIYGINPTSGISDTWINLDEGANTIVLKLYDGSLQVGRSITAQESVIVTAGLNITMDLVALHGETTFALTEAGGDATFEFNIPSEVVDEAGGMANLQVLFSLVGPDNPLAENVLTLAPDGSGGYESTITVANRQFGNIDLTLTFTDTSVSEQLGSCAMQAVLDVNTRTLNCNVTLRRRAVIGGNLLATLGINVMNEAGEPVPGASITRGGALWGITGSGSFGTEGYLRLYSHTGNYTIRAESVGKFGEIDVSLDALGISNRTIVLNTSIVTALLPDTGQTTCYDQVGNTIACPAPGDPLAQDGSYPRNPQSFNDAGDGTVSDNNTNLIWQQEDDNISRSFADAESYCSNLSFAGYTDWRLPGPKELITIVNFGIFNPAIDQSKFPNTNTPTYWTSSYTSYTNTFAWTVNFEEGHVSYDYTTGSAYVRCIRGTSDIDIWPNDFTDHGNGVIEHLSTGLMWQKEDDDVVKDWESSVDNCEQLSLAGYNDWRLPNAIELQSIVDYGGHNPVVDENYFPGTDLTGYWSSTSSTKNSAYAWVLYFDTGTLSRFIKFGNYFERCVRDVQ